MRSFYDKRGFLNALAIYNYGIAFNYIWGGRGTGKTYGFLKLCIEKDLTFIYLRSLESQTKLSKNANMSIYKKINSDNNWNILPGRLGLDNIYGMFDYTKDPDNPKLVGYCASLNTCANVRGLDFSDVDVIIYDEFIPKVNERRVPQAGFAFNDFYETVNRNRELLGNKPVQCFFLTNSNKLECDIFMYKKLMNKVSEMGRTNKTLSIMGGRNIALFNLCDSPISEEKANTVLYKSENENSDFVSMSIKNSFYNADYTGICKCNLKEYKPLCSVGEITIYEHKSKRDSLHVTNHYSGTPDCYDVTSRDIRLFRRNYTWIYELYLEREITFEDVTVKSLFEYYFRGYQT